MKKTYINPEMVVVPLMAKQMIANSLNSLSGLDDLGVSNEDFEGGFADVKGIGDIDLWDDVW